MQVFQVEMQDQAQRWESEENNLDRELERYRIEVQRNLERGKLALANQQHLWQKRLRG